MKKSLPAFFALAGRPLRLFAPIGIALATGGGTAIFVRIATPTTCLQILFLKYAGQSHFPSIHFSLSVGKVVVQILNIATLYSLKELNFISLFIPISLSYIIYQGTDILPEIFSSSPDTRVFVARKLHEGASPRVILSDKHECWTARKNFWRYISVPRYCNFNLVVGRKILWYFKLKILRGL
jgi:hypothetical protein